jgi:molybdate transport system ATP-binding protein/molybdate/tungstate transport system ATP-binding protein
VVRAENLSLSLGTFQLRRLTFTVETGQYAVLLGPTGSGKTVLLETLVGINRVEEGSVWIDDQNVTRLAPERRGVGFVYQRSMLFPHMSVRQNVAYGLRYHGVKRGQEDERVQSAAELVDIQHLLDRRIIGLSGGETQKVALARALAIQPRVLLLDEPLGALDPVSKEALAEQLRALHEELGATIVHVTHDQQTARMLGEVIGVLQDGQLLQFGPKEEIFDRPNSAFVARFVGTENVFEGMAKREDAVTRVELGCGAVRVPGEVRGQVGVCIRPELITIRTGRPSEDGAGAEAENRVAGRVEAVIDRGPLVRYDVATAAERFVVLQTKRAYAERGAAAGAEVELSFAPDAVHVFRRRRRFHATSPARQQQGA